MHLTFFNIFYQCNLNAFTHEKTLFPAGCTGINILTIFAEKRVLNQFILAPVGLIQFKMTTLENKEDISFSKGFIYMSEIEILCVKWNWYGYTNLCFE